MPKSFEIIDSQPSALGEISLRRRNIQALGDRDVYEVKLGEEYLMSSLFHVAEEALAKLAIKDAQWEELDLLVGGLGLGYTAAAALQSTRVKSLVVVEYLQPVISWHQTGKVPLGAQLTADTRCRFACADFFALARSPDGFKPLHPRGELFSVILLDIDHSPAKLLNSAHGNFYTAEGLTGLSESLRPGGIFAMWSDDAPVVEFLDTLRQVFQSARAEVVSFPNPLLGGDSQSTIYLAVNKA